MAKNKAAPLAAPLTDDQIEAMSFEEALDRLDSVVAQMQEESIGLEAAFALWEQGRRLHAHCTAKLDEIEANLEE